MRKNRVAPLIQWSDILKDYLSDLIKITSSIFHCITPPSWNKISQNWNSDIFLLQFWKLRGNAGTNPKTPFIVVITRFCWSFWCVYCQGLVYVRGCRYAKQSVFWTCVFFLNLALCKGECCSNFFWFPALISAYIRKIRICANRRDIIDHLQKRIFQIHQGKHG